MLIWGKAEVRYFYYQQNSFARERIENTYYQKIIWSVELHSGIYKKCWQPQWIYFFRHLSFDELVSINKNGTESVGSWNKYVLSWLMPFVKMRNEGRGIEFKGMMLYYLSEIFQRCWIWVMYELSQCRYLRGS